MSECVQDLLIKRVKDQIVKTLPSLVTLNLKQKCGKDITTSSHSKWEYTHSTNTTKANSILHQHGFHCIIIVSHFQPPIIANTYSHSIENSSQNDKNTPFLLLDVREQPWHPIMELLKNKAPFDHSKFMAVAVPKTKETLPLMVDLWRLNQYSTKGKSFIINKQTNK